MLFKKIKDRQLRTVINKNEKKNLIYKVILSNLFLVKMYAKIGRVSKVHITRRSLLTGQRVGINNQLICTFYFLKQKFCSFEQQSGDIISLPILNIKKTYAKNFHAF
jgi:hypothetical protein